MSESGGKVAAPTDDIRASDGAMSGVIGLAPDGPVGLAQISAQARPMVGRGATQQETGMVEHDAGMMLTVDVDAVSAALNQTASILAALQAAGTDRSGFVIEHEDVINCLWTIDDLVHKALSMILPPPIIT